MSMKCHHHCLRLTGAFRVRTTLLFGLAPFALAANAWGQEAPLAVEEIIVTAERRAADLQDVPIAITAMTGEQLDRSGIQSTQDLQARTPGLVFTTNASYGQPYIRGIGSDFLSAGADPSIAVHVDGIYQTRATAALQDLFDIDRVEIVKGPQGTLYGRNATGGAMNILTKDPTGELEAAADVLYGNYDRLRLRGVVNLPIAEDVSLRASGFVTSRDGYVDNALPGESLDGEDAWALRAKLKAALSPDLTLIIGGELMREDSTRNLAPKLNASYPAPALDFFGAQIIDDPRVVQYDNQNGLTVKRSAIYGKLEWDLGSVQLKSITSYAHTTNSLALDLDATEVAFAHDTLDEKSDAFSQEFQIASSGDQPFSWIVGAYYLHEKAQQHFQIYISPFAAKIAYPVSNRVDAYALFGQGTYKLTEQLRLTAGLRYSYEKKNAAFRNIVTDPGGMLTGVPGGGVFTTAFDADADWKAWTPKFGIDYQINDDVMVYASATRGFKSGGFNLLGAGEQFAPEHVWSYEAGIKSTFLDRRVRLNLSAFHYDYSGLQVNRYNPSTGGATTTVTNAASASVDGFEGELVAVLAQGLELDAGISVLDAKYKTFFSANPDAPDPFVDQDLSGNTMPRTPELTLSGGLQYAFALGGTGTMTVRGEVRHQSHVWFDQFNGTGVEQGAFTLLNGAVTWQSDDERWRVQVFGRNLTDKLYRQSVIRATSTTGTLDFWGAPRTYGIEIGIRY